MFVQRLNQVDRRYLLIHQTFTQQATNHMKKAQMKLIGNSTIRINLHAHLVHCGAGEETTVSIEELFADATVEFSRDTT